MVTQTAVMDLMKLTAMILVKAISLHVRTSSVSVYHGAVMEMMTVEMALMKKIVIISPVLQVVIGGYNLL